MFYVTNRNGLLENGPAEDYEVQQRSKGRGNGVEVLTSAEVTGIIDGTLRESPRRVLLVLFCWTKEEEVSETFL